MARNTMAMNGAPAAPTTTPTPAGVTAEVKAEFQAAKSDANKPTANASAEAVSVLHWSAGIVAAGIILLWVLGGIVFKNANL